jgi:lipoyl(octanoyl) transferase
MISNVWRIIRSEPADGAWNMAVDEAILLEIGAGRTLPTLRLYSWQPACLSLGFSQSIKDVNLPELKKYGWTIVRRPTGGRAILHTDELTYSVIAPLSNPQVAGSVLESYRRLSKALLNTLIILGLDAQSDIHSETSQTGNGPVCFEVPSNYEITVGGKKLIGSAQARRVDGVLQHGSLPLYGDLTRITRALNYRDEATRIQAAQRLLDHAATVEMVTGRIVTLPQAADAFETAFHESLGLELEPGNLTDDELKRVDELVNTKYANSTWTARM